MIGWAIKQIFNGSKVKRRMWANLQWIAYVPKGAVQIPHKYADGNNTGPFLVSLTKEGVLMPWIASQGDLLANDWEVVSQRPAHDYDEPRNEQPVAQLSEP
jgi:hypothetical protein